MTKFRQSVALIAGTGLLFVFGLVQAQGNVPEPCHNGVCPAFKSNAASVDSSQPASYIQKVLPQQTELSAAVQPSSDQALAVEPVSNLFELPDLGQFKRKSIFMTAVDDDGKPYSYEYGPIESPFTWRFYLSFIGLLLPLFYFFFEWSDKKEKISVTATSVISAQPKPVFANPIADVSPIIQSFTSTVEPHQITWSDLVRVCNGDPLRAATIISGEVAIDPSLTAGSSVAIERAYSRLTT